MLKVGMSNFGKYQMLARDWLLANFRCKSHKRLPNVGNFGFCQMLACQILVRPNVGNKPIRLRGEMMYWVLTLNLRGEM